MNDILNFTEDNKELFLFELEGKVATIAPELMAFQGYTSPKKSWNDIKNREEFEEGKHYINLNGDSL